MKLRSHKFQLVLLFVFLIASASAELVDQTRVKVSVAPIYREPDSQSEQVTQVLLGDPVKVTKVAGNWARIMVPDQYRTSKGYPGWVKMKNLSRERVESAAQQVAVVVARAKIYEEPSSNSNILLEAHLSTRLAYAPEFDNGGDWLAVRLPGRTKPAWVDVRDVAREETIARGEGRTIIDRARLLKGTPYLWGGMSSVGIDCSGLVYTVYRINGITVPRDADQQYQVGARVKRQDLEPGDMVFFGKSPGDITHVGLYAGEGRFIHASSGRGVLVSKLFEGWYLERYQGARRILKQAQGEPRALVPRQAKVSR